MSEKILLNIAGVNKRFGGLQALTDVGIPAGTYRLPYRWSEAGAGRATGSAEVILYAPSREGSETDTGWLRLASPGIEKNATNDVSTESETFVTVVPGPPRG